MSDLRTGADRILVVSLDNLGDTVWAGSLVRALRTAYPTSRLGLWCKEYAQAAARLIPGLDRVHAADPFWEPSPGHPAGSMRRFLAVIRELRRTQYEIAILVNTRWKVAAAVRAAGVPTRIGFAQRRSLPWITVAVPPEDRSRPVLSEWARLLAPLGVDGPLEPRLEIPEAMRKRAEDLRLLLPAGRLTVLHPFAGDRRRCAHPDLWAAVVSRLADRGSGGILMLGTAQELAWLRQRTAGLPEGVVWADRVAADLDDALLLVAQADLFIGHDSGPLHCSAAFGVPSVGLFLPGDWPRAAPRGAGPITVLRRESPEALKPEAVLTAVEKLLDTSGPEA